MLGFRNSIWPELLQYFVEIPASQLNTLKAVIFCLSYVIHGNVVFEDCWNMWKFIDHCYERRTKPAPDESSTNLPKADWIMKEGYEPRQFLRVVSDIVERLAVKLNPRQIWYRRSLVIRVTDIMLADD